MTTSHRSVEVLVALYSVTPASARRRWTGEEGDEGLVFNCCLNKAGGHA